MSSRPPDRENRTRLQSANFGVSVSDGGSDEEIIPAGGAGLSIGIHAFFLNAELLQAGAWVLVSGTTVSFDDPATGATMLGSINQVLPYASYPWWVGEAGTNVELRETFAASPPVDYRGFVVYSFYAPGEL